MNSHTDTMLQSGDVVAMIGDSITCDARWWLPLREQVLLRLPDLRCEFRNAGLPGGNTDGALRRYAWDIAPLQPTLALVMFGMNDVWRDAYVPDATDEMITGRAETLERFLRNMDTLVARLLGDGVRVALLTPTRFDQYAPERPAPNRPGADDALAICAGMIRGMGLARRLPVIDLHTPLRRRCAALEPLIGEDRIHPNDLGHAAMAVVVIAALLPGAPVPVPPALHAANQALHDAERQQRMIAMFRVWAERALGSGDDDAIRHYIAQHQHTEPNPWVREQMQVCLGQLPRQAALAAEVAELRRQLADAAVRISL